MLYVTNPYKNIFLFTSLLSTTTVLNGKSDNAEIPFENLLFLKDIVAGKSFWSYDGEEEHILKNYAVTEYFRILVDRNSKLGISGRIRFCFIVCLGLNLAIFHKKKEM